MCSHTCCVSLTGQDCSVDVSEGTTAYTILLADDHIKSCVDRPRPLRLLLGCHYGDIHTFQHLDPMWVAVVAQDRRADLVSINKPGEAGGGVDTHTGEGDLALGAGLACTHWSTGAQQVLLSQDCREGGARVWRQTINGIIQITLITLVLILAVSFFV